MPPQTSRQHEDRGEARTSGTRADEPAAVELLAMATLEATSGRIDVWPPDPLDPETANRIYKMARRIDQDRSDSGGGY